MQESLSREKSKKSQENEKRPSCLNPRTKRTKSGHGHRIGNGGEKEFKTKCEFKGVGFEADLSTMYIEIHRYMAGDFPEDFGPETVQEPGKDKILRFYATGMFGCFVLTVVSLGAKFNNRYSTSIAR